MPLVLQYATTSPLTGTDKRQTNGSCEVVSGSIVSFSKPLNKRNLLHKGMQHPHVLQHGHKEAQHQAQKWCKNFGRHSGGSPKHTNSHEHVQDLSGDHPVEIHPDASGLFAKFGSPADSPEGKDRKRDFKLSDFSGPHESSEACFRYSNSCGVAGQDLPTQSDAACVR